MADVSTDPQLLISGFLRRAKAQPDPVSWLNDRHSAAFEAVAAGAVFITGTSSQEGGHTAEEKVPAQLLMQIYEVCLQTLEAEADAAAGVFRGPGSVRYADFSSHPCTLG